MEPLADKHYVRWRLDFADGSHKAGAWSNPGNHASSKASMNLRPDLVRASIEARDVETQVTSELVSCLGPDFREFKWLMLHKVFANTHAIAGLTLVTAQGSTEILLDGKITHKLSGE